MSAIAEEGVVICSCCGRTIPDDPQHNVDHGTQPSPHDEGFGMCKECGGDAEATGIRKRLGWATCAFYDARIKLIMEILSPEKRKKFAALPYERKAAWISEAVERGFMI